MSGAAVRADLDGLARMAKALNRLAAFDRHQLLDDLGATLVAQTQRRITEDRKSPAGVPWPKWSKLYEKTRHANQKMLFSSGQLVSSLTHNVLSGNRQVEVGSNLVYAATHQFGDKKKRKIPARPYLGVSERDATQLETVCRDFLERQALGAMR